VPDDSERWRLEVESDGVPTEPVSAEAEPETPPPPLRIIEAMLFVGGEALTVQKACEIIRGLTPAEFEQAVHTLNRTYRLEGRPYSIRTHDHGYALSLRPQYRQVLDKLYGSMREARLSAAAVDVLALVAYRQPASKHEIDSVRGVESGNVLRQLVRRGLISVVHRGDSKQREVSYGTTARFLKLFGLQRLDDLPRVQDLQRL